MAFRAMCRFLADRNRTEAETSGTEALFEILTTLLRDASEIRRVCLIRRHVLELPSLRTDAIKQKQADTGHGENYMYYYKSCRRVGC